MKYTFICYKGCSTCRKAEKYLIENNITYNKREITEDTPTVEELKSYLLRSDYSIKDFFNTRGTVYRDLNLKDKYDELSDEERLRLLSTHGMLIKRPLLIGDDGVLIGFKEAEYKNIL